MINSTSESLIRQGAIGLVLLALGGLPLAGCGEPQAETVPDIRPVRVTKVRYDAAVERQTYAGVVAPRYESAMAFRVGGKIAERLVDVGQTVTKGQVLARLDPTDLKLQLRATQAQLRSADADLVRAREDYDRYEQLKASVAYNRAAHEQRIATYRAAQARVEQLKDQIRLAENQLAYADLQATADGVVTQMQAEAGQVVQPGQTVMTVARTDELEVVVAVPESRLTDARTAPEAMVGFWTDENHAFTVTLREVAPTADPATRTYRVRYSLPAASTGVQIGMSATLTLSSPAGAPVATLPLTAIFQRDGKPAVWVLDPQNGNLTLKPVTVAAFRQNAVAVTDGVKDGEQVVTAGVHKLDAGMKVRVMTEGRS